MGRGDRKVGRQVSGWTDGWMDGRTNRSTAPLTTATSVRAEAVHPVLVTAGLLVRRCETQFLVRQYFIIIKRLVSGNS